MINVYLSYAPQDQERAAEIRRILLAQGHRPWVEPNAADASGWHAGMEAAMRAADALVLLLTSAAAQSIAVTYEWSLALGLGIPVFALVDDAANEHPRLQLVYRYDRAAFGDENHFWDHFVADFKQRAAPRRRIARPAPEVAPAIDKSVMPEEPGYWLVMRRGPLLNQLFRLEREVVNIGRDLANDIVIRDPQVSRYHARLTLQDQDYSVEDLDSSNGTGLNGAQISGRTALKDGDLLALGDSILLTYDLVYLD